MTGEIEIPASLDEARAVLTDRPVGVVPFQIRAQLLAVQGVEQAVDAAVPVVEDYYVGAILDLPNADVPVTTTMLEEWRVTMDDVVRAGAAARAQAESPIEQFGAALVIRSVAFAAAALRDPAAVSALRPDAVPVIVIPDVGHTLVGFADDHASLASVAAAADRVLANTDRSVSITPLVRGASGWERFEWPESVAAEVGRMGRRWDQVQYSAARDVLNRTYAAAGVDVFVATLELAQQGDDGPFTTYATVTKDVHTVIPRADFIVLNGGDGRMQRVPFERLLELPGVLTPSAGTVPDHFEVSRFPEELLAG
ncbi:hypothetical protein [Microbacterium murale]|uniref:Uncharacterized protein n=1 Tax=Microbacterium murale TaxID=1081040 RepID=A0ABU0P9Q6_9MICO|nr:hypothetical protein [Microbacterium murale]MDQ0644074.1 hypothetical protein [Microbacterium murale]